MSFGSLGARAVTSMSHGAAGAQAYHNTGEGGGSPYHKSGGADIMWQLGTGYFGARDQTGRFSLDILSAEVESCPAIRCIEIKLSQGAKPGKGGILPGAKVTPEIAAVRGIPMGRDCISPNGHSEFGNVDEMMDFIQRVADLQPLEVLLRRLLHQPAGPDPRVRHEHVKPTVRRRHLVEAAAQVGDSRHVALDVRHTVRLALGLVEVVDRGRTCLDEPSARRGADARRAAGDDHDLTGKVV